jgi:hypothetical protein
MLLINTTAIFIYNSQHKEQQIARHKLETAFKCHLNVMVLLSPKY